MLTLITGVPGAGKTIRAVQKISEIMKENERLREKLAKGKELKPDEHIFNVYANIKGLKIEGVQDAPEDWRQCVPPAKWFYDEAQYTFPCVNQRGLDTNPIIAEVATHRHLAIDLFLITQHPNLISAHVRKFVGRHEHLDRRYGYSLVSIYMNDALMNVDSGLKRYESEPWTHPKDLYDLYESASLHINNSRLPWNIKFMFAFIFFLLLVVVGSAYYAFDFFTGKVGSEVFETQETLPVKEKKLAVSDPVPEQPQPLNLPVETEANVYVGCIATQSKCRCWFQDGSPAFLPFEQCQQTLDDMPTPLHIVKQRS